MSMRRILFSRLPHHQPLVLPITRQPWFVTSRSVHDISSDPSRDSPAQAKLRSILEEYRQKNFGQTLFSRFVHEVIYAADANHDGKITLPELQRLFVNIGADGVTDEDLAAVMDELGTVQDNEKVILVDRVEDLIFQNRK